MTRGTFVDELPWVELALPTREGDEATLFVVDTGFEGDLAVPRHIATTLDAERDVDTFRQTADGRIIRVERLQIEMSDYLQRPVEVLVMEGNPLIGTTFLRDQHLHIEMADGGEVYSEPL